ncbi:MAG: hypothetical protein AAF985_17840 [Bacteroidota bacterium]
MLSPRPIELILIQFLFYLVLWLWNDYIASLISAVFACIFFFILLISLVVEWIEPSKVPRSYFVFMLISVLCPILVGVLFFNIMGGNLDWLNGF